MRPRIWPVLLTAGALAVGCGASGAASAGDAPAAKASIVGRWQQTHKCTWLVHALKEAHLRPLAPGVIGDYFPNKTPQQLARKRHLCRGATPQRHSHFFTSDGGFGSVDQHGQQVDEDAYRVINGRTVRIGNVRFRYQITSGDEVLALQPVITKRMRREALADPLEFSAAGWSVAVAYPGHTWKRVSCGPWC
jgi:hypothetical protein